MNTIANKVAQEKRYKLAKDLPLAKAGTKIYFCNSGLDERTFTYEVDPEHGLRMWVNNAGRKILEKEGWIKEVIEPREFYIAINIQTGIIEVFKEYPSFIMTKYFGIIKVREVIEKDNE